MKVTKSFFVSTKYFEGKKLETFQENPNIERSVYIFRSVVLVGKISSIKIIKG